MLAGRAHVGRRRALVDVAAVAAVPLDDGVALENPVVLQVRQ